MKQNMLGLFKRYQKFVFIITAFFVCISVVFLGLLPRNLTTLKDEVVYKTKNGRKIKRTQMEGLKALLLTSNGEMLLYGNHLGMQFFAEDFFSKYLAQSGLIKYIAEKKENELMADWEKQLKFEKNFKPYVHPQVSFLGAKDIWARHAPKLKETLDNLQKETDPKKAFEQRLKLFSYQNEFTPFALWQFLSEREASYQWAEKDENLRPQSLALFGYRNPTDWFGEKMIQYACEFIYHMSSEAKKRGYHVSLHEAEQDLLKLNNHYYEQMQFLGLKEFSDPDSYFEAKLNRLGMNKMQMVSLWREVLLLQQFMSEASQAPLFDNLTLKDFEDYASDQVEVCKYVLPAEYEFKSMGDLAQFEAYLSALGKKQGDLSLDFEVKPFEELEKKYPQLVEEEVEVSYKEVSLAEAALSIKVQDVWKWKTNPANANSLIAKFPKLTLDQKLDPESYAKQFEAVDFFTNMQMDQHVRQMLLKESPDWQTKALKEASPKVETRKIRRNGHKLPFKGLELSSKKEAFLKEFFAEAHKEKSEHIPVMTFDDQNYYQILSLYSKSSPKLVSYKELKEDKTLDKMLQKALTLEHKKSSYSNENFEKVKDKVLSQYLGPVKEAIKADYQKNVDDKTKYFPDSFFCRYRAYKPMRELYNTIDQKQENQIFALNSFIKLKQEDETIVRYESDNNSLDSLLSMQEGDWYFEPKVMGAPCFMNLLKKGFNEKVRPIQQKLRSEIKQEMTRALVLDQLNKMGLGEYSDSSK